MIFWVDFLIDYDENFRELDVFFMVNVIYGIVIGDVWSRRLFVYIFIFSYIELVCFVFSRMSVIIFCLEVSFVIRKWRCVGFDYFFLKMEIYSFRV